MIGSDLVEIESLGIKDIRLSILWALEEKDMEGQQSNGLTGFSNYKVYKNFIDLAYEKNQLKTSIFALQIGFSNQTSFFYAGDYATDISNITFLPCKNDAYWQIKVETMYVNDKKFTSSKLAVVDSGTSALVIPNDMAKYFLTQFPSDICKTYSSQAYGSFWGCDCYKSPDNYPVFKFYTEKIKFEINSADYMYEQNLDLDGETKCIAQPLIMTSDALGFMIFGDVFMRKYLVTFDKINNKVGFSGNLIYVSYLNNKVLYGLGILTLISFGIFLAYGLYFFCYKLKRSDMSQPFLS